jgi:hypothetical protein
MLYGETVMVKGANKGGNGYIGHKSTNRSNSVPHVSDGPGKNAQHNTENHSMKEKGTNGCPRR